VLRLAPCYAKRAAAITNNKNRREIRKKEPTNPACFRHLAEFKISLQITHRHLKGPPPRRWYKAKFGLEYSPETNDNIIKKSGENGETTEDFDFGALTKDHYCRYREAGTEREGQCCTEEDDHCYTKVNFSNISNV
jgi:hypothetical protein